VADDSGGSTDSMADDPDDDPAGDRGGDPAGGSVRDVEADVAVVGAGGAGLSLVLAIDAAFRGRTPPRVVLVDPAHRRGADRTWCFWDEGPGDLDTLLHRTWQRLELIDGAGRARRLDVAPLRYVMLRSQDYYAAAEAAAGRLGVRRVTAPAGAVEDTATGVVVHAGGHRVTARWAFDSRPAPPRRPGRTTLVQHFRGWTLRLPEPLLDPGLPTLMDFSVPQPAHGVAFVYCLPLDARRALVEYTEFSRERLPSPAYDAALEAYLRARWGVGIGDGRDARVEAVEDGAIPMTDAPFARRAGRHVFRLGTAGGATRPSTGYTFAAMRRQAAAVATSLRDGVTPLPPAPYPARHRWMDAVLLRALDRGYAPGPELFTGLFERNPPQRVLRFLDGATRPAEDLAIMATSPRLPMLRAGAEDAAHRAARRARAAVRPVSAGRRRHANETDTMARWHGDAMR
jgi:lycopene beta-cyclase